MTINWKLRESVFKLLAAVYAELGETAFKGRYGNIAQFYGSDATYDAVKSFFAKEIAKLAEELQNQNLNHPRVARTAPQQSSLRPSRRRLPLHLDFDDQDISVVGEREVGARSRHALQRPPKRPRLNEVMPGQRTEARSVDSANTPAAIGESLARTEGSGFRAINQRQTPQLETRQSLQFQDNESINSDPTYIPTPSPPLLKPNSSQQTIRKHHQNRPPEVNVEDHSIRSTELGSFQIQELESFSYVTEAGEFRCALCLSQLASQHALQLHESKSDLHLRNLKNPARVAKGRANLAQVTSSAHSRSLHSDSSGTSALASSAHVFSQQEDNAVDCLSSRSQVVEKAEIAQTGSQKGLHEVRSANPSKRLDTIEVLRRANRSSPSQINMGINGRGTLQSHILNEANDNGKRPARSWAVTESDPPHGRAGADGSRTFNPQDADPHRLVPDDVTTGTNAATIPPYSKSKQSLRPLEVAEILRLTGIRLAEKYMADHPDLIAQTMERVRREFSSISSLRCASAEQGCTGEGLQQGRTRVKEPPKPRDENIVVID